MGLLEQHMNIAKKQQAKFAVQVRKAMADPNFAKRIDRIILMDNINYQIELQFTNRFFG